MGRFRKGQRDPCDLGDQLRENRPEPSADFLRAVSAQIRPVRRQSARRADGFRLAPLTGMIVLVLVAAGVFGGIAVANGGGQRSGEDSGKPRGGQQSKPDDDQYKGKVVICHKPEGKNPRTIRVRETKVEKHLARGDYLGACETADVPVEET